MSQVADTHVEYTTKFAQAKEKFDREIATLRARSSPSRAGNASRRRWVRQVRSTPEREAELRCKI
jgi:hypothetical protein